MEAAIPPTTEVVGFLAEYSVKVFRASLERTEAWAITAVVLAALTGLVLLSESLWSTSATYDEVAYLRVAATWWRTGDQDEITRMGSPLTFWKLQQVPVFWLLDRIGLGELVDDPIVRQAELLPLVRFWSLSIWLAALLLTAAWSRRLYGPQAMALAAWLFALGPNLLAHGALVTMELPLVACTTAMFFLFWTFLQTGGRRFFWATAAVSGLAWSCKYTTVLVPPMLGLVWWIDRWGRGERGLLRVTLGVSVGMLGFLAILFLVNLFVTGFAMLPVSERTGSHPSLDGRFGPALSRLIDRAIEMPIPQDLAGFAKQVQHQRSGGPSYLLGERRMHGWWYYYLVALAVKVPLTFWLLVAARLRIGLGRRINSAGHDWIIPTIVGLFLAITAVGSSRNYGLRYLLPLAPLAIVWVSGLAEGGRWARGLAVVGLLGQALAVASIHPYELSYFNVLAGGPAGGRHILADSNLDWGQGLKALARLQRTHAEYRKLTLYYFGDTRPVYYGVDGGAYVIDAGSIHPRLPRRLVGYSEYVAVSASLQWGPWGPPGYFKVLDGIAPERLTDDGTIAIYRWMLAPTEPQYQ
jgi:4-amino-4-deoxy-L-arabinose transferase-like glycosyltransferase